MHYKFKIPYGYLKRHLELPFSFIIWPLRKKISPVAHWPSDLTLTLLVMHTEQQQYTEWVIKKQNKTKKNTVAALKEFMAQLKEKSRSILRIKKYWLMQYRVLNQKSLFFQLRWNFCTQSLFLYIGFFIHWERQKVKLLDGDYCFWYVCLYSFYRAIHHLSPDQIYQNLTNKVCCNF